MMCGNDSRLEYSRMQAKLRWPGFLVAVSPDVDWGSRWFPAPALFQRKP